MGLFKTLRSLFGGEKAPDTERSPAPSVGNLGAPNRSAPPPVQVEEPPPSIGNLFGGMGGAGAAVKNAPALDPDESGHVGPPSSGPVKVHNLDVAPKTQRSPGQ